MTANEIERVEEYRLGDDLFVKSYRADGAVLFSKNGQPLSLAAWNREINRRQPMALVEQHANPLIRFKENQRRRAFLRLIECQPDSVIADVGSESGYLAERLRPRCQLLYCIDIDRNLLALARQRLGDDKVIFIESDIQNIQLPDDSVDVAVAAEILEHLPDPTAGLRELARITRPGGRIYVSVPNEPLILFIKKWLRLLRLTALLGPLNENLAIGHTHVFDRGRLRRLCRGVVEVERLFYNKPLFFNIFAVLRPLKACLNITERRRP